MGATLLDRTTGPLNEQDIAGAGDTRYVSAKVAQSFTQTQKAQARANIDALKRNYAINGGMMVSQENGTTAGAVGSSNYFPVDEFPAAKNLATGTANIAQVASTTPGGSPNRVRVTVTAAQVSIAAGERSQVRHVIEGLRCVDLLLGTASAKTITIQFGVKAPAGTYCIGLGNNAGNRSYIAEYTITAGQANTDVIKSVTIPLDQTGTWTPDTTGCLWVYWTLAAGSTFQTAAGAWTAGFFTADSNQFNLYGTNGNVFELFDVGIYEGVAAPNFQLPDFISELALCQRYWEKSYSYATALGSVTSGGQFFMEATGVTSGAQTGGGSVQFKTAKRIVPTVTTYSPFSGASGKMNDGFNAAVTPAVTAGESAFWWTAVLSSASTSLVFSGHFKADARM